MKLITKKIIAREFLIIIASAIICLLAFGYGKILDNQNVGKLQKMKNEVEFYDSQIVSYLSNFRKKPQVDSIFMLQMEFYSYYSEVVKLDSSDYGNYFFWINVRKSIQDSTFNLLYANDEIISQIKSGNKGKAYWFLLNQNEKRLGTLFNGLEDVKSEFKYFALHNNYERYLPANEWKKYQDIRLKTRNLESEINREENKYFKRHHKDNYLENAFTLVICLFFLLRYLFYIILWSIKILKQKQQ